MTEKTCNGWKNYETWNVNLWIDNDQGSQAFWQVEAQTRWDDAEAGTVLTREENAIYALAEALKDHFEEEMDSVIGDMRSSMWSDLLGAALSEVDWDEIAGHMIDEVDKTVEAEDEDD